MLHFLEKSNGKKLCFSGEFFFLQRKYFACLNNEINEAMQAADYSFWYSDLLIIIRSQLFALKLQHIYDLHLKYFIEIIMIVAPLDTFNHCGKSVW